MYNKHMGVIVAEIMHLPQLALNVNFSVRVLAPVEMPWRVYNVSVQEIITKSTSFKTSAQVIFDVLTEKVLYDYNKLIEDSPIMDMFADPIKYEQCSDIEWITVDLVKGTGLEPVTPGSSDQRSTN